MHHPALALNTADAVQPMLPAPEAAEYLVSPTDGGLTSRHVSFQQ